MFGPTFGIKCHVSTRPDPVNPDGAVELCPDPVTITVPTPTGLTQPACTRVLAISDGASFQNFVEFDTMKVLVETSDTCGPIT